MTERELLAKRDAFNRVVELATGRFPPDVLEAAGVTGAKVEERLRHGTSHTVVALAGPTGSGKSSLFNALVGAEVSSASVRRPTTGQTHAAIFGSDDASALLDWLDVRQRHHVDPSTHTEAMAGLVLLDLPDHDSTAADHQIEVDRLVALVDVLVWVTEPQKYADHVMHDRYLRPLSSYGEIMVFVVSKVDLLTPSDEEALLSDYAARLEDDGIASPRVVGVSATEDPRLAEFVTVVAIEVAERRATVARLEADLSQAAGWFLSAGVDRSEVPADVRRTLATELAVAAGADRAGDAVARQHERNGLAATGWPATRWARRVRKQPFADVPVATGNAGAEARVDVALRDATESVGEGLGAPWPAAVRHAVDAGREQLVAELGRVTVDQARSTLDRPRWWGLAAWWQRIFGLATAAGAAWLIALAVMGGLLRLDTDPLAIDVPGVDWLPIPTALLLGGAVLGLLGAFVAKLGNAAGAKRRAIGVRKSIGQATADVADVHAITPMNSVLAERVELHNLISGLH